MIEKGSGKERWEMGTEGYWIGGMVMYNGSVLKNVELQKRIYNVDQNIYVKRGMVSCCTCCESQT